jgi:peptide/nickel transport system ATP-binding protein
MTMPSASLQRHGDSTEPSDQALGAHPETAPLLEVRNVTKIYGGGLLGRDQTVALENFSLTLPPDKAIITTIAGESGSGKTTLANLVLGFITPTAGKILYNGKDIYKMSKEEFTRYRREVQAVFQDPYEVYNPFYKVDHVFDSVINKFRLANSRGEARQMAEQALEVVGLPRDEILGKHPHQLSGGQRQRVMVARAFLLKPRLIVADEPVSMVDASLRGMILEIMMNLQQEFGISFLYITHDLSTAYQISQEIYILYSGSIAEVGDIEKVVNTPYHPYTQMLISSVPLPDPDLKWDTRVELPSDETRAATAIQGCKFRDRCPHTMDICGRNAPPLYEIAQRHYVACYLYRDDSHRVVSGDSRCVPRHGAS